MTISVTETASGPFYPNGVTTEFPFDFRAFTPEEAIFLRQNTDGTQTIFSSALYSVTPAVDGEGGTLTFDVAPAASALAHYVAANPRFDQEILFEDEGPFNSSVLNPALDRGVLRDLWLRGRVMRAPLAPADGSGEGLFPSPDGAGGWRLVTAGPGAPGAADNTYTSVAGLKASDVTRKVARLADLGNLDGEFLFIQGDFTALAISNPTDYYKSDAFPITVGAWVRRSVAALTFKQNGAASKVRNAMEKLRERITAEDFGAIGDGVADDTAAIQAMLDYLASLTGAGRVGGSGCLTTGKLYRTTDTLIIKSFVQLRLNSGKILADFSNKPIIQMGGSSAVQQLIQGWSVLGPGWLEFATQQTSAQTNGVGFRISHAKTDSYNFRLGDGATIVVNKPCTAIDSTPESGSFPYVGTIDGVLGYSCASWCTNIDCDTSTGGGTNILIKNLWALQPAGAEQADARGHRFRGMVGLRIENLMGDHLQKEWLFMESCFAEIGHLAFESCDVNLATGQLSLMAFAGCPYVRIDECYGYHNEFHISGDGELYVLRPDGLFFDFSAIHFKEFRFDDTSSGAIYTVNPTTGTRVTNETFTQTEISAGAPVAPNFADFGTVKKIHRWNGVDQTRRSTLPTAADNAAAITAGLAVGMEYKTATGELRVVV